MLMKDPARTPVAPAPQGVDRFLRYFAYSVAVVSFGIATARREQRRYGSDREEEQQCNEMPRSHNRPT